MRLLLFFLVSLVFVSLVGCNGDDSFRTEPENSLSNIPEVYEDSLTINLSLLNDSLTASVSQDKTRILNIVGELLAHIHVISSDVKGAAKGAKIGGFLGFVGRFIGAAVVGVVYSTVAAIIDYPFLPLSKSFQPTRISREHLIGAYAFAKTDTMKYINFNDVQIQIPSKYQSSYEVGRYHNLTLNCLANDKFIVEPNEQNFTAEEIELFNSDEFIYECDYAIEHPEFVSTNYMLENYAKEDRIVQLFLDLLNTYPQNLEDVEFIVNKYIEVIENDKNISEEEKSVVYSALSTAAFSATYWTTQQNDE